MSERTPRIIPPEGLRFQQPYNGTLPRELAPLEDPGWVPLAEAEHMRDADPVIVVTPSERSYVVPWWVLKNHHVANLTLEGNPVTVTLCERCSSSTALDARVDGERRTFQVVAMWKGTHVIADHETESLWTSFSGECIWGFHRGVQLGHLPIVQMRWQDCAGLNRGSLVVDGAGESRRGHGAGRWPGSEEAPMDGFADLDPRLSFTTLVLGVEAGGAARAYPVSYVEAAGGVVNDTVGGVDLVVFAGRTGYSAAAFERRLDDRVFHFRSRDGAAVDEETGSIWDLTGFAVSGSLAGRRLAFVYSQVEEWHAWSAYHPSTDIAPDAVAG
jgi:Protein of unknown function (DUF3179)